MVKVHRLSWELHNGPIPDGMLVCHHCDVRNCVRPEHLFLGNYSDNAVDMVRKGRAGLAGDRHWSRQRPDAVLKGQDNPYAKLSTEQVLAIRAQSDAGASRVQLAAEYGVSASSISQIALRRSWRHA